MKDTLEVYFANLTFKGPKATNVAERLKHLPITGKLRNVFSFGLENVFRKQTAKVASSYVLVYGELDST